MNQWRRRTIRLILALILVLCVLLFSETEAEGVWRRDFVEQIEEVKYADPFDDIPDNVYYDTLENEIDDYFDTDVLVVDEEGVECDPRVGGREYDELYPRPEFSKLPHCPDAAAEDGQHGASVVVSTLDGRITGLDLSSGAVKWSHQTGLSTKPLLSSSMSKLEVTSGGEWVRLIPSLDGGIFRFDGEGVEALPVSAQNLLHSSFKFNPDTIFTGGKATEVWGMALGSGRIVYVCNTSGCKRNRTADKPAHVLVVRRVTQTVRAVDPKSGDERWNFSVGQHEVNLAGDEGCKAGTRAGAGQDEVDGGGVNNNPALRFIVPDGVVMGVDDSGQLVWKQKLTSPVVSAWRVSGGVVEEVDLFSTISVPALTPSHGLPAPQDGDEQPALYVGVHQKQLYIQQSGHMRHQVTHATKVFTAADTGSEDPNEDMGESVKFPRVEWRPYLATAPSRTPILHHQSPPRTYHPLLDFEEGEIDTAIAVMHQADYPFDNGYYLYADPSSGLNLSRPWERPTVGRVTAGGEEAGDSIMEDLASNIIHICFHIGPDMWMQLSVGLACYLLLHYLLLRYLIRHMRHRFTQQALLIARNTIIILLTNPHILRLIQRMGLQLPALPPAPAPAPAPTHATSPPLSFNPSTSSLPPPSEKSDSSSQEYTSRYLTDFELVRCLGRGGFGMVFQVRNKLDENEYAVKRIILPAKEKSAERVKREVRALAKLNHTNIVRYYNSWLESPPPGWQDEVDALWKNGDALSTSLLSPSEEISPRDTGIWPEQGREASDTSLARAMDQKVAGVGGEATKDSSFDVVFQDSYELSDVFSKSQDNPFSGGVAFEDACEKSEKASKCSQDDLSFDILFEDSSQDPRNVSRLSSSNGEDESIEVVFEEPQKSSWVYKCKRMAGDDSVDVLFEDSCNSSRACGRLSGCSDGEEVSSKSLWKTRSEWSDTGGYSCSESSANINSNKCKNSTGDCSGGEDGDCSDSIVFEDSKLVNIKYSPVSSSGHSADTSHPHPNRSQSQEVYSHQLAVGKSERRRIKSYPALNNHSPKERPSSLGLSESSVNKPSPPIRDDHKPPRDAKGEGKGEAKGVEGRGEAGGGGGRGEVAKLLNPRTFLYIQMELCQKESLRDWLMRNQTRDKDVVLSIFNDIVKAVEYVHDNHLMHRDLKPSNIFFSLDGEVKIGDFGLVTTIAEEEGGEGEVRTPAAPLPASVVPRTHTHRVGTQLYMSPEQVSGATYDYKVDIFSLGLVLLEMLLPFTTGMERMQVMSRARLSQFPQDFPNHFPDETSLLELMLSADSSCRPTTRGVRARPPLRSLQGPDALGHIHPSHHFHLPRHRPHSSTSTSASVSSN